MYDIAIAGSGFAGSLTAMVARRLGLSVAIVERGSHPRFMIGESSTPLSNLLLEELANTYDLPAIRPLTKWGSWQSRHPTIGCGLKRGFTFYHHGLGQPGAIGRENSLLVAANPHDRIADTHWYRADFDHFLLQQAQEMGADYYDETSLESLRELPDLLEISATRHGQPVHLGAKFLVDATGPRGFLHRALNLDELPLPNYPKTQALYSHFTSVERIDELHDVHETPPYPIDDSALHHLFDGGWVWVLRFNNGRVSAGVAANEWIASQFNFSEGESAWRRLLAQLPAVREQFEGASAVEPFRHISQLSFCSSKINGKRWALLPSAAGFVDPLLSTGFPQTLLGISRMANILKHRWDSPSMEEYLATYSMQTGNELLATARLVSGLYANMGRSHLFKAIALLYFAAASFSETARRLNKPDLAPSFLLNDHPSFGPACERLLELSLHIKTQHDEERLIAEIMQTIEPIDVAGLCRADRNNWYPVDAKDLLDAAHKVDSNRKEIQELLNSCGFYP
ncbi:NAD(P)/FAD-dependent oxidoreductase [Silvibacterium acidisoli]|uniref:NAD(P)/FAD-dependent oxidoreductase n=1 Tax=Acidobacteriaceae bacterium ZG23-2 TaxID=2883246 RepID=UPI00406BF85B